MSIKSWLNRVFGKKQAPRAGTKAVAHDTCDFCKEQVFVRQGGVTMMNAASPDFMETLRQASKRKFTCPMCGAVFCLECGNNKGHQLGTGSTHCPKCGTKVL